MHVSTKSQLSPQMDGCIPKGCLDMSLRGQTHPKGCLEKYKSKEWTDTSIDGRIHPTRYIEILKSPISGRMHPRDSLKFIKVH